MAFRRCWWGSHFKPKQHHHRWAQLEHHCSITDWGLNYAKGTIMPHLKRSSQQQTDSKSIKCTFYHCSHAAKPQVKFNFEMNYFIFQFVECQELEIKLVRRYSSQLPFHFSSNFFHENSHFYDGGSNNSIITSLIQRNVVTDIEVSEASVDNDLLDVDGDGSVTTEIGDDVDFGLAFDTLPTIAIWLLHTHYGNT